MNLQSNHMDLEKMYMHALDHLSGAVIIFAVEDGVLKLRYLSDKATEITGYTPQESYARCQAGCLTDVHPDDRETFSYLREDHAKDAFSIRYRLRGKDSTYNWVNIDLSREEENGEVFYYGLMTDIDKQHKVEELQKEISRNKEMEQILLNSIPGGVAMYHVMQDGTVRASYVSEGLAGILGYTTKEFLDRYGNDTRECVFEEDRSIVRDALRESFTNHTPIRNHYRCYKKDGSVIPISFDGNLIDFGTKLPGEIATLYAVQSKISDAHQKVMEENELRQKIIDHLPSGVGIYDLYHGVMSLQYLNNAYFYMMDLKKEDRKEYFGTDISPLVYPEDRPVLANMINEIYQGKQFTNIILRIKNGIGVWKWINLVMWIVPEADDHYTGYASMFDFDQVIHNQQEMEAARKKEETLLSSIPGGIAIYHVKKNGTVTCEYVSEPLAKMCGYNAEEFLAYLKDNSMINLVPEDIPMVSSAVEKALTNHENLSVVYHIYKKDRTPILIRLDANIIDTDTLAEDEVGMFYAVHTLVSDETIRIMDDQKRLSELLNAVPAGIGIFKTEHGELKQEYMNEALYEILWIPEEGEGNSKFDLFDSIHPEDYAKTKAETTKLIQGSSASQMDFRVKNGKGGYTWLHAAASVTERTEKGLRIFCAFFNYEESKEREFALIQNSRAVELAQRQGDLSIWTYNLDRRRIRQQDSMNEIGRMGYQTEITNVPESFIESGSVHPEDIERFRNAYQDLEDGKTEVDVTYRLKDQNLNEYHWLRMFYQRMEDNEEHERMAAGFSMNVDKQQEAIERYRVEQSIRERLNENITLYLEYNLTKDQFESEGKAIGSYRKENWESTSDADYLTALADAVEEPYVASVYETMSAKNLLRAFAENRTRVSVEYRSKERKDRPSTWYRTSALLVLRPDTGDIMAFIYVENIEVEKQRKLAIDSSLTDGIESIAIIQVEDGQARLIREDMGTTERKQKYTTFVYNDDFVWRSHMASVDEDREFSYQAALLSTILKKLEEEEVYSYSISTQREGGQLKRQLFRWRYLDDRKKAIVLSISNITEVYLQEQAKKKQLEQALAEATKASAAKAEFYSRMSHDMRTPMNGILGMTALSENETDITVLRQNMEKIQESGEYLLNLINDTLDIQRIESGKLKLEPQIVETRKTVDRILEMVQPLAEAKGVQLLFDSGNTELSWYVRIDPVRIKQIFVNLLSNAIKFTPKGGKVFFTSNLIRREGMLSKDVFTIQDTGIGMSEAFLKHGIFQPFSQESNQVTTNYAGSGLGLSIVKSLVELMGGRIEVKSELGVGSTFTVYLDLERVNKEEAEQALHEQHLMRPELQMSLTDKKILLVEDHPLNAEIARKLLEKVGCAVTWEQNGQLGMQAFADSEVGFYDAILMDIRMPVMDGLEAAKGIRSMDRSDAQSIPIIAMTANAYEEDIKKSVAVGMNAHLGKPIEINKLYQTLSAWINQSEQQKKSEQTD